VLWLPVKLMGLKLDYKKYGAQSVGGESGIFVLCAGPSVTGVFQFQTDEQWKVTWR
jgi:hypothetical protein